MLVVLTRIPVRSGGFDQQRKRSSCDRAINAPVQRSRHTHPATTASRYVKARPGLAGR
jgi:hypothetical protein